MKGDDQMIEAKALFMKSLLKGHVSLAEQLFPHLSLTDKEKMEIFKSCLYVKSNLFKALINQMASELLNEALTQAILCGNEEAVRLLLKRGADPTQPNRFGEGTLHLAIKANGTNLNIIDDLMEYGADIRMINRHNLTPILKAASFGLLEVVDYFVSKGTEIERDGMLNEEVLSRAASSNHLEVVHYCLEKGIQINQKVYFMTIFFGHDEMIKYLLHHDPHTPFTAKGNHNPLAIAATKGSMEILQLLLIKKLPVNEKERIALCSTALMAAIEAGHGHLIPVLLKAGADINYVDQEDESVLDVAIAAGNQEIAACLLRLGAKRNNNRLNQKVVRLLT
jgi:ankyrin repeat protein